MKLNTAIAFALNALLLSLCCSQALAGDSSLCGQSLQNMTQNLQDFINSLHPDPHPRPGPHPYPFNVTLSKDNQNFMGYSGRFLNDFGEYDVCQNSTTSHYLTFIFTAAAMGNQIPGVIGFCAPNVCSAEEAQANSDVVFELYQKGMGLPFDKLTSSSETSFYDPRSPAPGSTAATVLVILLFIALGILTMVGTGLGVYWETTGGPKTKKGKGAQERLLSEEASVVTTNNNATSVVTGSTVSNPKPEIKLFGIYKFLDCFDARKNFEKLTKVKYTETYDFNLEIFNGIRVFMMLYVVFGHSFLFGLNYIDNTPDLVDLTKSWLLLVLNAALFSVDVFFYMSGFLFAYIGIGKLKKMRPTPLNYVGLLMHRFLRIWPTYTIAVLFFWRILPLMGSGPVWFEMTNYTSLCDSTIWQNLLFLDDLLVKQENYCYGWGWYLSNDFQMFLITPLFLWLYVKRRRLAKLAMVGIMIVSWIISVIIAAELNLKASPPTSATSGNPNGFSQFYVKPYIRLPPYFIGVLVALMYKEYKEKVGSSYKIGTYLQKSTILKNIIWFLGLIIILLLTFLPRQVQMDPNAWPEAVHVIFRAFQKSVYVIAMTMVILPILLGDHNLLKRFLSHPLLVPLARLSFTAYLVHLFWVYKNYYEMPFSFHFTFGNGLLNTLSNGAIAFATGLILSLIAEVPMANIETTYVSGGGRRRRPQKPQAKLAEDQSVVVSQSEKASVPLTLNSEA